MLAVVAQAPPPAELAELGQERVRLLSDLSASPELLIPAATFTWMRPSSGATPAGGGCYDAVACDTAKVAESVLGGIPLGVRMIADHMTAAYEAALDALSNSPAAARQ